MANEHTYSKEALAIAIEHDLTIMGTSDIHGLIDWEYENSRGRHRPVTLVLARDRSAEAAKEALVAGRTVVWYDETLIGRTEWMDLLVRASLEMMTVGYFRDSSILEVGFQNRSDAPFHLRCTSDVSFYDATDTLVVDPHSTRNVKVSTPAIGTPMSLEFEVMNAIVGPNDHFKISFTTEPK
ncbi:MAG: Sb-PDE family phosphodiesterase [Opitutaceae bacterium]